MRTTLKDFESVFPRLVEDLTEHCTQYKLPQQALEWFQKVGMLSHTYFYLYYASLY